MEYFRFKTGLDVTSLIQFVKLVHLKCFHGILFYGVTIASRNEGERKTEWVHLYMCLFTCELMHLDVSMHVQVKEEQ